MKRFILSMLSLVVIASVPTAAFAINATITVNGTVAATFPDLATPAAGDTLCSAAPCSVNVRTPIADANYPIGCTVGTNCLLNILGAYAEATVQTNAATIGASSSITTITNISGTIRYIGPAVPTTGATIEIVTSNKFALPSGVWTTVSKGGFKCKNVPPYSASTCSLSSSTVQSGTCTLCRAFGYTDEGYVTRPDPLTGGNLPANGVTVTMTSNAIFEDTAVVQRRTEAVGGSLSYTVPVFSVNVEDGHFYLGDTQKENIACEPLKDSSNVAFTCGSNETKTATLTFTNVQPNDLILMPATSTTVSASDPAVLQISLQADIPIDVQPIDPVFDPGLYSGVGGYKGGENNDFNVNSGGQKQVAVFSTPNVDACLIEPYDLSDPQNPVPLVFVSVAGSDFTPLDSALGPITVGTTCIGQNFQFSIPDIVATIPTPNAVDPNNPTLDELQAACLANPTATVIIAGVTQVSGYSVTTAKGGKKSTYTVAPECTKDSKGNVTCTVTGTVGGAQVIKCATPSGQ
jgi:hypothetical protein